MYMFYFSILLRNNRFGIKYHPYLIKTAFIYGRKSVHGGEDCTEQIGYNLFNLKVGTFVHAQGVIGHPKIRVCLYIFHTLSQDRN